MRKINLGNLYAALRFLAHALRHQKGGQTSEIPYPLIFVDKDQSTSLDPWESDL